MSINTSTSYQAISAQVAAVSEDPHLGASSAESVSRERGDKVVVEEVSESKESVTEYTSSDSKKTTSQVEKKIEKMRKMFSWIKGLNYWGVKADGTTLCPLGCLKCSKVMYKQEEFRKTGPAKDDYSRLFCNKHAQKFQFRLSELVRVSLSESKETISDSLQKALEPLHQLEAITRRQERRDILKARDEKTWVYFG